MDIAEVEETLFTIGDTKVINYAWAVYLIFDYAQILVWLQFLLILVVAMQLHGGMCKTLSAIYC